MRGKINLQNSQNKMNTCLISGYEKNHFISVNVFTMYFPVKQPSLVLLILIVIK